MTVTEDSGLDVWADPAAERLGTPANVLTVVRTVAAVTLAAWAAVEGHLGLLVLSLAVYWVGDVADGLVARYARCETRIGAVLDILCDRFCAAAFYLGLVWLHPEYALPVMVYLAEFMVVDCFLSMAFLAWPIRSPNYFYVVDRTTWVWNWSKPAKAANSAIFAVLLLTTGWTWLALAAASALLVVKSVSVVRLVRVGLPVPGAAGAIG